MGDIKIKIPEWNQGFSKSYMDFESRFKGDTETLLNIHASQKKIYEKEIKKFNKYKGETINVILEIERKMDCIILGHFMWGNTENLMEEFYYNFFSIGKLEFMAKKSIVHNIYKKRAEFFKPENTKKMNDKLNKPFTLLTRIIEYRNTLAHSYYYYHIDSDEKSGKLKRAIKGQRKGKEDVIFDINFQNQVKNQISFIFFTLDYIYNILMGGQIVVHTFSAFHTIMGLDLEGYPEANFIKGDIKNFLNEISHEDYGVNIYY